jgi:hypothetical protein
MRNGDLISANRGSSRMDAKVIKNGESDYSVVFLSLMSEPRSVSTA